MAILTSHTLNGVDGTHAGGIAVTLSNLSTREIVLTTRMDDGGRLSAQVDPDRVDTEAVYELVFDTAAYWAARNMPAAVTQIALRFAMPDSAGHYHMPVIVNPSSYAMWMSR